MHRGVVLLIAFLLPFGAATKANDRTSCIPGGEVLFVVYDAGETFGLLPVVAPLKKHGTQVTWVPLTPWTRKILADENQACIEPPIDLNKMAHLQDRHWDADIRYWEKKIRAATPHVVVFGMVSRIQEQLADTLRALNVTTRGFYDSFEPTRRGTIVLQISAKVDEVWVPNEQIRENLISLGIARVRVVGQPSLENWLRLSQKTVSQEIYLRQGIGQHQKVIVFAGQYGDGYEKVVQSFLAQANKETLEDENLTVVVSPHPRTSGELERKLIDNLSNDRLLIAVADLTTAELATIASVVITWTSTVGVQAAFMGKPVIYYSLKSDGFRNDLTENDIAKRATPDTFSRVLRGTLLDRINGAAMRNRLRILGYGIDASDAIAEEICKVIPGQE